MTREYIIISVFLLFSFLVGFINRAGSSLNFIWGAFYVIYLIMAVVTTALLVMKDLYPFRAYEMKEIERVSSNLLIIGVFTIAPWVCKLLGYEIKKLWKNKASG